MADKFCNYSLVALVVELMPTLHGSQKEYEMQKIAESKKAKKKERRREMAKK